MFRLTEMEIVVDKIFRNDKCVESQPNISVNEGHTVLHIPLEMSSAQVCMIMYLLGVSSIESVVNLK